MEMEQTSVNLLLTLLVEQQRKSSMPRYIELLSKGNKVHMAQGIGISRQTIYDLIAQKYKPNYDLLVNIAKYFKLSVEDIL